MGAGAALPPLLLDDEEAIAVAVGLHAAAGGTVTGIEEASLRALTKLRQLLPSRLRHRTDAVRAATDTVASRGPTVDAETLTVIAAAIRDREGLRFDYLDHDGTASRRSAEPHRLVFTGRRWYLVAWDDDRDDWRTFRADRIRPGFPTAPASPRARRPGATPSPTWSAAPAPPPGRTRPPSGCTPPPRRWPSRSPPAAGLLRPDSKHTSILETGSDSPYGLVAFLSSLEVAFTFIEPPELRELPAALAARYQAAARDPSA